MARDPGYRPRNSFGRYSDDENEKRRRSRTQPAPSIARITGGFDPFNKPQQRRIAEGVREEGAYQAARERRRQKHREVLRRLERGQISEAQAMDELRVGGLVPPKPRGKNPGRTAVNPGAGGFGSRFVEGFINTGLGLPAVPYVYGRAAVRSVRERSPDPLWRDIGKPVVESFESTIRHPGRDPFNDLMNVLAAGSLGVGTVAKGAAVARAPAGGKLAAARRPTRRSITVPGSNVVAHPPASINPALNAALRVRDRALANRIGAPVQQGMGTYRDAAERAIARTLSPEAKVGRELAASRRVRDIAELAPAERLERFGQTRAARLFGSERGQLKPRGKRLSAGQQKALDILASGRTPEEHMAAHLNAREAGIGRAADHARQLRLTKAASAHLRDPKRRARIEDAYRESRELIREREGIYGMDPDDVAFRVGARSLEIDAMARGLPSPADTLIIRERGPDVVREQLQVTPEPPPVRETVTRPRTEAEARRRLEELEGRHTDFLNRVHERLFGERLTADDIAEQARRNARNARIRRSHEGVNRAGRPSGAVGRYRGERELPTVRDEQFRQAEAEIEKVLERMGDDPAAQRLLAERREMDDLRERMYGRLPGDEPDYGTVTEEQLRPGEAPPPVREPTADELRQRIIEEGRRVLGEGGFYVRQEAHVPLRGTASGSRRAPGPAGFSPPQRERFHRYGGVLQRTGNFRTDVTGLTARAYRQAQRWAALDRGHKQMLAMAKDAPDSDFDVPIRATREIPEELRDLIARADEGGLSKDDLRAIDEAGVDAEALRRWYFPDPKRGENIDGVRWVDVRLLGELARRNDPPGAIGKVVDAINAPARASVLYTRPAYLLNLVQNLGTAAVRQGVYVFPNARTALTLGKRVGEDNQRKLFALAGDSKSRALEPDQPGFGKGAVDAAAEFWNAVTDRVPRVMAILHEARVEGFKTPKQLNDLLNNPARADDLAEVVRRANLHAVPYGELTPLERNVIKRAIFFYPWLRAATVYTFRFPGEHPYQAAVNTPIAQDAYDELHGAAEQLYGRLPSFLEGALQAPERLPLIGGKTVDPSALSTTSTPAELIRAGQGFVGERPTNEEDMTGMLGPVAGAVFSAVSGEDSLGREMPENQPGGRLGFGLQQLAEMAPGVSAYQRWTKPEGKGIKEGGPEAAVRGWVAGGVGGFDLNAEAVEEAYDRELTTDARAAKRFAQDLAQERKIARQLGLAAVPRDVVIELRWRHRLEGALRRARKAKGDDLTYKERLAVTVPRFKRLFTSADITVPAKLDEEAAKDLYLTLRRLARRDLEQWHRVTGAALEEAAVAG